MSKPTAYLPDLFVGNARDLASRGLDVELRNGRAYEYHCKNGHAKLAPTKE